VKPWEREMLADPIMSVKRGQRQGGSDARGLLHPGRQPGRGIRRRRRVRLLQVKRLWILLLACAAACVRG